MARQRLIAYLDDESGLHEALALLDSSSSDGNMVFGYGDEQAISGLEELGSTVSVLGPEDDGRRIQEPLSLALAPLPFLRPERERMRLSIEARELFQAPPAGDPDVYLLELLGPPLRLWRSSLLSYEVRLLTRVQDFLYEAEMPAWAPDLVGSLTFVRDVRRYVPADTIHLDQFMLLPEDEVSDDTITYDVVVHDTRRLETVISAVRRIDLEVMRASGLTVRFRARMGDPRLLQLARMPEVALLDRHTRPEPALDHVRPLVGIEPKNDGSAAWSLGLTGAGQVIAVADTGLDAMHPDLVTALLKYSDWGGIGQVDPDGHGTHVAGIALGDGTSSGGEFRGIAPQARLFFQGLSDADGQMSREEEQGVDRLLREAYEEGARIYNASWTLPRNDSSYQAISYQVDDFVMNHPDMLVVVAAGNAGTALEPLYSPNGFVDWYSMGAPSTAKNALAVGASCSDRPSLVDPALTWKTFRRDSRWLTPPIADAPVSGDAERIAAFSSRGPGDRNTSRIKPDIVAPGTFVLSTRASTGLVESWAEYPQDSNYAFCGGTSMAAPVVAGAAALVRQWLIERDPNRNPSAALVRAILLNGAEWLHADDATATNRTVPNLDQGFGRLALERSIPNSSDPFLTLHFRDPWGEHPPLAKPSDSLPYWFDWPDDAPERELRMCLTWDDPPGGAVQNNLGIILRHIESGERWVGNGGRADRPGMELDPSNNVHVIRLDAAPPGRYQLLIQYAASTRNLPQTFALVVTGAISSGLHDGSAPASVETESDESVSGDVSEATLKW